MASSHGVVGFKPGRVVHKVRKDGRQSWTTLPPEKIEPITPESQIVSTEATMATSLATEATHIKISPPQVKVDADAVTSSIEIEGRSEDTTIDRSESVGKTSTPLPGSIEYFTKTSSTDRTSSAHIELWMKSAGLTKTSNDEIPDHYTELGYRYIQTGKNRWERLPPGCEDPRIQRARRRQKFFPYNWPVKNSEHALLAPRTEPILTASAPKKKKKTGLT